LSTLPQLEKASRLVARAAAVFIEELGLIEQSRCDVDVAALWGALEEVAPRAALSSAATVVVSLHAPKYGRPPETIEEYRAQQLQE
ncbi:hypothetical protein ACGFNX_33065, partial [Streptomyces sp. NPDC048723]|uniref:hypothetical protein n=1 Tax=Streptomyces sp. NPDC048723 TaxID=3365589 RepID=UPI003714C4BD